MEEENPITFDRKPGLYLKRTEDKGRGLFCMVDIAAGEVLEVTPALILNDEDTTAVEDTIVSEYSFSIGEISDELMMKKEIGNVEEASCVVMGIASFCNHSRHYNAEVAWEEDNKTLYYTLQATRDIPAHTEICTSYGEGWFDDRGWEEN